MGSLGIKFSINQLVLQDNQAACTVIGYQNCLGILPFSQIQLDKIEHMVNNFQLANQMCRIWAIF